MIKAIRGATIAKDNTEAEILSATTELLTQVISVNNIGKEQIISIVFTCTQDLTKAYPAVAARNMGYTDCALLCLQEMNVDNSLPMCIRIMLTAEINNTSVTHCYIREAKQLRRDL